MPTSTYNVTETAAGFGDGDTESNAHFVRRAHDPFWFTTPLLFGDDVIKGSSSRDWVLDRFVVDVPEGATVRRVTMSKEPQVTDSWFTQLRFCILDPQPAHSHPSSTEDGVHGGDANWRVADATRDTPFPWSNVEPNTAVYDDAAVERPFPEAISRQGFGGQLNILTLRGMGTLGGAFTVETASFALGEIRLRISRSADLGGGSGGTEFDTDVNTSRPGLNLRIEIYNAISVTDRRPTGAVIVSSNTVSWDSLDFGTTPGAFPLVDNWGVFVFPTNPTLALGNTYTFKLVVDGGGVMPAGGPPYIRTALDLGFTNSASIPSNAGNNNAAGVWWGAGGFGGCAYPPLDGLPNPAEADAGPLVAGRVFQDDECISPQLAASLAFVGGTRFVWGFDLDGGPGIDHELDGSHPNSTTDIVTLFQNWIDDPAYTEAGTPTAITLDPVEILLNERNTFASQEDPTDVGTELIIGWILVPTKATVPSPITAAIDQPVNVDLSWVSGTYPGTATGNPTHDVYFGTTPTPGAPEFKGNQLNGNVTFDPGLLLPNTEYFWRIDEVGPFGTTTGDVWSFTTIASITPSVADFFEAEIDVTPAFEGDLDVSPAFEAELELTPVFEAKLLIAPTSKSEMAVEPSFEGELDVGAALEAELGVEASLEAALDVEPAFETEIDVAPAFEAEVAIDPIFEGEVLVEPAFEAKVDVSKKGGGGG